MGRLRAGWQAEGGGREMQTEALEQGGFLPIAGKGRQGGRRLVVRWKRLSLAQCWWQPGILYFDHVMMLLISHFLKVISYLEKALGRLDNSKDETLTC